MKYRLLLFPMLVFPLISCSSDSTPTEPPPASEFAGRWWVTLTVDGSQVSGPVSDYGDDDWGWNSDRLGCTTDHQGSLISYIEFPQQKLQVADYQISLDYCGDIAGNPPVLQVIGWDDSGEIVSWLDILISWEHVLMKLRVNRVTGTQYSAEQSEFVNSPGTVTFDEGTNVERVYVVDGYSFAMKRLDLQ